ncbi:MAG: biotin/acetyl-CoA-carboxylase ligase [Francisellaceae bacterium]|nr:biotin/acetyl-CoA-carboxylase ligase [Francisellaceae bacterium]
MVLKRYSSSLIKDYLKQLKFNLSRELLVLETVSSTNEYLLNCIKTNQFTPQVVIANEQTHGKGQQGKTWVSPLGNICLSIHHRFPSSTILSGLSLAIGISIAEYLRTLNLEDIGVKWPNDIFWKNKKLGGILIETIGGKEGFIDVIIGVGLNVQLPKKVIENIEQPCIDLINIMNNKEVLNTNWLISNIVINIINSLEAFEIHGFEKFLPLWPLFDILQGKVISISNYLNSEFGMVKGIAKNGALLVEVQGKIKPILSSDYKILSLSNTHPYTLNYT